MPLHAHPYAEVFYILEGQVDFTRLEQGQLGWMSCTPGDTLIVPSNAFHDLPTAPNTRPDG